MLRGCLRKLGCTAISQDKRRIARCIQRDRSVLLIDVKNVENAAFVYNECLAVVCNIAVKFAATDTNKRRGGTDYRVRARTDRLEAAKCAAAIAETTNKHRRLEIANILVRIGIINKVEFVKTGTTAAAKTEGCAARPVAVIHPREEERVRARLHHVTTVDRITAAQRVFAAVRMGHLDLAAYKRHAADSGTQSAAGRAGKLDIGRERRGQQRPDHNRRQTCAPVNQRRRLQLAKIVFNDL